ncbi:MAG TPA: hypothetical protein VHL98_04380 [Microvirga sp.]|jgi:DNA-binding response OmpR family regulator|nr:hypothetical protein [Microvirga sp.]
MRDSCRPLFCLVVEDDPRTGLDLADALEAAGCAVAGPFRSGRDAARWLERFTPDVAVVDPALADGLCPALLATLRARGIRVVMHSGDPRTGSPVPARAGETCVGKPTPAAAIVAAVHALSRSTREDGSVGALAATQQE